MTDTQSRIHQALSAIDKFGSKTRAAKELGISRLHYIGF